MADADLFAAYQEAVADRDAAGKAWADNTDPALSDDLLDAWLSASQLVDSRLSDLVNDIQPIDDSIGATALGTESPLVATVPIKLTASTGNSKPRLATDALDNIWMVWHSDRSGNEEVYVARYFGQCGVWSTSGQGGEELKVTNFGPEGRRAMNPNVAVGSDGQVHVAFQGQTEDGRWEIYYCHSTAGGSRFTVPIRITNSPGNALMPDIAVFVTSGQGAEGSATVVVIVWHDDRFGSFEIMAAQRVNGEWASSGQGGSDTRITQAAGDSMFPRVDADTKGNVRVVYQDSRRGESNVGIYMSTFVGTSGAWDSSASGGSDRLVSNGPAGSFNPDIDIDKTGGISVAWHDLRNAQEDPEQHEEIYALYCPRLGHPSGAHYPPLQPNIEARLDADFEIVDGVGFKPILATNSPEIYLAINAPNATFWRASNEDGQYSKWQEFRPNFDLETMLVPWTLNCVGGKKQVCVQVQDAEMVGFPICRDIDLALQPPDFQVEFFEDADLTIPLATTPLGRPAARQGDVYIKLSTEVPQILPPTFEVVSRGQRLILNQETEPLDAGSSDTVGIGSFVGGTVDISQEDNVSPAALAFSAAAGRTFRGRFSLKCHDGLLNVDGPARVVVKPMDICGKISAGPQDLAEGLSVVEPPESNVVLPDLDGDNPSNELRNIPTVSIPDPDQEIPGPCGPLAPCTGTTGSVNIVIGDENDEYDRVPPYYTSGGAGTGGIQTCENANTSYVTTLSQPDAKRIVPTQPTIPPFAISETSGFSCGSATARMFSGVYAWGEGFSLDQPSFLKEITLKIAFTYNSGGASGAWYPPTVNKSECLFVVEIHRRLATYMSELVPGTSIDIRGDELVEYESLPPFGLEKVWDDSSNWTKTGLNMRLCAGDYYLVVRSGRPFVGQPGSIAIGTTLAGGDTISHGAWTGPGGPFGIISIVSWPVWNTDDCQKIDWRDQWGRESHFNKNYHMYTRMKFEG